MKFELRKVEEAVIKGCMYLSSIIVVLSLLIIVMVILWKGIRTLSLSMIFETPKGGFYLGKEGGILNAIIGSFYIAGGATVLAFFLGLPIAFYLQGEYIGQKKVAQFLRVLFDTLFGIPSIVYGAFGFTIMVFLGLRASLLAGIITVTLLELPIMIRGLEESIKTVPWSLKEASYSIGATKLETYLKVAVRQCLPGIVTAIIIAFGRGIGDAASVLFTAGFSDNIPKSLFQPTATLPLAIFFQLGTPFPEVQKRAYASAIILLGLILFLNFFSRYLQKKLSKHIIR
jgi:phosphate transport system permease protein